MIHIIVILSVLVIPSQGIQGPRLVFPRLLQERASDGKLLLHIHDTLTLNLEKASVAAPNLYVHSDEGVRSVVGLLNGEEFNDNLYEDVENLATVSMLRSGNRVQVAGLVGPRHRIEPLMNSERSEAGLVAHVIHEISQPSGVDRTISIPERALLQSRNGGPNPDAPRNVTVEIFVITDEPHHGHFKTEDDLITYLCVTLNSVNLRFRTMRKPKVRLLLVGVERSSVESFRPGKGGYVHDLPTLSQLRLYAANNTEKFKRPDVLFYITGRDVVTRDGSGNLSSAGLGIAYVAGLCTDHFVGLAEDSPGYYTGVGTISHEVAHLLGAEHDGEGPTRYVDGHPGAKGCPWDDGYLMSYIKKGPQQHQFSSCSLKQMQHVIRLRGQICWTVVSQTHLIRGGKYPGSEVTLIEQCKQVYPSKTDVTAKMVLRNSTECEVQCEYNMTRIIQEDNKIYLATNTYRRELEALDYTSCGEGQVCLQGICQAHPTRRVKKHSNPA